MASTDSCVAAWIPLICWPISPVAESASFFDEAGAF